MTAARSAPGRSQNQDSRPVLMMVHGFALDARMWRRQVDAFGSDYRVMTVDLPGFGPQAREVGEVEPAAEVGRAMNAAKLDRAHLVGTSFGAAVVVDYALANPDRVASLTLVAPMLIGRKMLIDAWPRCVALANDGDRATAAEVWLDDALFETLRLEEELFEEVRQIVLDYGGHHWTGKVASTWGEPEPIPRLANLKIPTLILSGERDIATFLTMAETYEKAIPGSRREVIPNAGHHVSIEASTAFNESLRRFLASVR